MSHYVTAMPTTSQSLAETAATVITNINALSVATSKAIWIAQNGGKAHNSFYSNRPFQEAPPMAKTTKTVPNSVVAISGAYVSKLPTPILIDPLLAGLERYDII